MSFLDGQADCIIKYSENAAPILLSGTVTEGDCLGYSGGWERALATVGSVVQMKCVAGEDGVSEQTITAYFGFCILGGERFSGATTDGAIYVAEGTSNGMYTDTLPSTVGDATGQIGIALDATTLLVYPQRNAHSVKA